jgi:dihydroxyacetone kinase-like protein
MESFLNRDGGVVVEAMNRTIQNNVSTLSEIDGAIGDGDHGINMNKGFTMCAERLAGKKCGLSESLTTLGAVLVGEIGGAMGPLYGTFFLEMGKASKDRERIDRQVFQSMLEDAARSIADLGNARVGDKTILDALYPALDAFSAAGRRGRSFSEALGDMAAAAEKGKEATRNLVAKVGRSSRLGERSRGTLDPGATSCALLLASMARSMTDLLRAAQGRSVL